MDVNWNVIRNATALMSDLLKTLVKHSSLCDSQFEEALNQRGVVLEKIRNVFINVGNFDQVNRSRISATVQTAENIFTRILLPHNYISSRRKFHNLKARDSRILEAVTNSNLTSVREEGEQQIRRFVGLASHYADNLNHLSSSLTQLRTLVLTITETRLVYNFDPAASSTFRDNERRLYEEIDKLFYDLEILVGSAIKSHRYAETLQHIGFTLGDALGLLGTLLRVAIPSDESDSEEPAVLPEPEIMFG